MTSPHFQDIAHILDLLERPVAGGNAMDAHEAAPLKAAILVMLYSAAEAGIRVIALAAQDRVRERGIHGSEMSAELRAEWVRARYHALDSRGTSWNGHSSLATALIEEVVAPISPGFMRELRHLFPVLDYRRAQRTLQAYGLQDARKEHEEVRKAIEAISARRMELAHGDRTFSEIGRDYSATQLRFWAQILEEWLAQARARL